MKLVKAINCDIPDTFVSGTASIEHIATGIVRVTYYSEREDEDYPEGVERRVVDSQVWSIPDLADNLLLMQKTLKEFGFSKGRPPKLVVAAGMH
jgi:hypothetical protein